MEYEMMANEFLKKTETTFKVVSYQGKEDKWNNLMDKWNVKLVRNGETWRFPFYMGSGNKGKKPTAYDVLACLTKYDVGTFEDFCADFGYDVFDDYGRRNNKNYRTYKAVKAEYKHVVEMFGDVLDELCEIA